MNVFEVLEKTAAVEDERLSGNRAIIAAQTRAKVLFGHFVSKASDQVERDGRISVIANDLHEALLAISDEYGYDDIERLHNAATVVLGGGHASDCSCGFCANKGNLPGAKKDDDTEDEEEKVGPDDDTEKTAASVETGDTYTQERVDLDPVNADGELTVGSPKIDKSRVPADGLKPVDVPSKMHPSEVQPMDKKREYEKPLPGPSETGKSIDPDKALQPEHTFAPHTDTWNGTEGLANPVTSKWHVID